MTEPVVGGLTGGLFEGDDVDVGEDAPEGTDLTAEEVAAVKAGLADAIRRGLDPKTVEAN